MARPLGNEAIGANGENSIRLVSSDYLYDILWSGRLMFRDTAVAVELVKRGAQACRPFSHNVALGWALKRLDVGSNRTLRRKLQAAPMAIK